jgi:hypothetical protein
MAFLSCAVIFIGMGAIDKNEGNTSLLVLERSYLLTIKVDYL